MHDKSHVLQHLIFVFPKFLYSHLLLLFLSSLPFFLFVTILSWLFFQRQPLKVEIKSAYTLSFIGYIVVIVKFSILPHYKYMLIFSQREYFKQGKIDQFRQILEEGSSPGTYLCFYKLVYS